MSQTPDSAVSAPILFYDGDCGLCARSVQWCLRHDRRGELRFAPLQGPTFAARAEPDKPVTLDTVVLADIQGLHVRSEAAIRALKSLGGVWALCAAIARLVPRPLRDAAYRFVATRRIGWFGRADRCDLPKPEDRPRFLP